jgi:glycosyltransferase involved in cell wall biosynthesis
MPTVSVIMLTWNPGPYLAPAIDSILSQTMGDLELILVDDGSTEGFLDKVLLDRSDTRIRLLRNGSNIGIGASYAKAIPECASEWIAIMDHDDIAHPMRLRMQLDAVGADPTLDAVATGMDLIDLNGKSLGPYSSFHTPDEIENYSPIVMPVAHPTLMGKKELFRKVGYRSGARFAMDYDLVLRALESGYRFGSVSIPLYHYRRHPSSASISKVREHEVLTCAVQLCASRRRSGADEKFEEAMTEAQLRIDGGKHISLVYRDYAYDCACERDFVLAAVHAAFSVRARSSVISLFLLLRYLVAAVTSGGRSVRHVAVGLLKGIFGSLLQRKVMPAS